MSSSARARALAAPFLALALAAAAAVFWQDFAGALPLGLFNEGRETYPWLAAAALAAMLVLAALFGLELVRGRATRLGGAARGLVVSFLLLEGLVTALDVGVVSRGVEGGPELGGPYREATSPAGTRVFLKRPHPGSPLGFRTAEPNPKRSDGRRLLFLGDSYTEGSGRAAECNYPEVAVATLNERLAARGEPPFALLNAGVAGYGPRESLALLRFLVDEGYRFDGVVLNLFLENDFTDDLPGTERRVVAGINFRFPRSAFLRWLHPLNTRTARYALFLWQLGRLGRSDDAVQRGDGNCRPPPPLPEKLPPRLRDLVLRRLEDDYGRGAMLAEDGVADALAGLRRETRALGVPLVVVVFPDRILADREIRERLGLPADLAARYDLGRLRRFVAEHAGVPVIDATAALTDGAVNYRPSDTHLSDVGNVVAGRAVGERLAELLGPAPAR
jgi:lysophospholipase L1-like esterase